MNPDPAVAGQAAELSLTRIFDAPRLLVWTVWTDPKHASQWWGPQGFTTPVYESDLRPGGAILVHMRAPDGAIYPSKGTFDEVIPPERLVMTGAVEIDGTFAFEARTTVTFAEDGAKTTVTIHQAYSKVTAAGADAIQGAREGWTQQSDRLDAYLLAMQQ